MNIQRISTVIVSLASVMVLRFLAGGSALMAQLGTKGSILGIVKDSTGGGGSGWTSDCHQSRDRTNKKGQSTDEKGYFEVLALPQGNLFVVVSRQGFKTWKLAQTELKWGSKRGCCQS